MIFYSRFISCSSLYIILICLGFSCIFTCKMFKFRHTLYCKALQLVVSMSTAQQENNDVFSSEGYEWHVQFPMQFLSAFCLTPPPHHKWRLVADTWNFKPLRKITRWRLIDVWMLYEEQSECKIIWWISFSWIQVY